MKLEKCFEIKTKARYNVTAGQDHPFMIIKENGEIKWVKTKNIKPNDIIVMAKPKIDNKFTENKIINSVLTTITSIFN